MKRYFQWNVEDAVRIAVIESDNDELIYEVSNGNKEIDTEDLPADFSDWQRYSAFAHLDGPSNAATVDVMSREGE